MDDEYCQKCRSLYYDKEASLPSCYIGEGMYVYTCKRYKVRLSVYLDGAKGEAVFRCGECKDVEMRRTYKK